MSAGYWIDPHLGVSVDVTVPGAVGVSVGTRYAIGEAVGLDLGIAGGPLLLLNGPSVGLTVAPYIHFALRGKGRLNLGLALPGEVGFTPQGAQWAAPLLIDGAVGWTFGTVGVGLWGNVGTTVSVAQWALAANGGLWLGINRGKR